MVLENLMITPFDNTMDYCDLREDVVVRFNSDNLINNAPKTSDHYILVARILDGEVGGK